MELPESTPADANAEPEQFGSVALISEPSSVSIQKSEWWRSASVITGEVMGTGVLSLPYACAQLGWVLGLLSSIAFGCAAMYSGRLLSVVKNHLYPEVTSYMDAANATFGPRFATFTRAAIMSSWGMIMPYYLIGCAAALDGAFPSVGLCYWQWSLVVALMGAPVCALLRSLHQLAFLSLISTAAVILVVVILVAALIASAPDGSDGGGLANHHVGLPPGGSFMRTYNSLGSFVFAFQGQSMMFEIMREMREPRAHARIEPTAAPARMCGVCAVCVCAYACACARH